MSSCVGNGRIEWKTIGGGILIMEKNDNSASDGRIGGEQTANMLSRQHLYALSYESLAIVENEILPLARPEAYKVVMTPARKKAIVSLVASAIQLVDIANTLRSGEVGSRDSFCGDSVESKVDGSESKLEGGGGGIEGRVGNMNGCLPHSNSQKIPKKIGSFSYNKDAREVYFYPEGTDRPDLSFPCPSGVLPKNYRYIPETNEVPQKFPKKILVFYRWLSNLLDLSQNIKLSEEEWSRSYELHTIRRESGNPVSTRRVPY